MALPDKVQQLDEQIAAAVRNAVSGLADELRRRFAESSEEIRSALEKLPASLPASYLEPEGLAPIAKEASVSSRHEALADLREAVVSIDGTSSQAGVLGALLEGAGRFSSRAALFLTRSGEVEGWGSYGFAGTEQSITDLTLDYGEGTPWGRLAEGRGVVSLVAGECAPLCSFLESPVPREAVLIPLLLRDRLAAALYADSLEPESPLSVEALQTLAYVAAQALETLPFRQRRSTPTLRLDEEGNGAAPGSLERWDPQAVAGELPAAEEEVQVAAAAAAALVLEEPKTEEPETPVEEDETFIEAVPETTEEAAFEVEGAPGEPELELPEEAAAPLATAPAVEEEPRLQPEAPAEEPAFEAEEETPAFEVEEEPPAAPDETPTFEAAAAEEALPESPFDAVEDSAVAEPEEPAAPVAPEDLSPVGEPVFEIDEEEEPATPPVSAETTFVETGTGAEAAPSADVEPPPYEARPEAEPEAITAEDEAPTFEAEPEVEAPSFEAEPEAEAPALEVEAPSFEAEPEVEAPALEDEAPSFEAEPEVEAPAFEDEAPTFEAEPEVEAPAFEDEPEAPAEPEARPEAPRREEPSSGAATDRVTLPEVSEDETILLDRSATVPPAPPAAEEEAVGDEPVPPPPPPQPTARPGSAEVLPPEDVQGPGWAFSPGREATPASPDQAQHDEARRLARLLVSEIRLYNEEQIEEGRRNRDIYQRVKDDIERSRQIYHERIDSRVAESSDYFSEELVSILAGGDPDALGM